MKKLHVQLAIDPESYATAMEDLEEALQEQLDLLTESEVAFRGLSEVAGGYRSRLDEVATAYRRIGQERLAAFSDQHLALSELGESHNISLFAGEDGIEAISDYHRTIQEGILDTALTFEGAIARSLTATITGAQTAQEGLKRIGEALLAQVIQLLVRLSAQAIIYSLIQKKTQAAASGSNLAAASTATFGHTFASVMASLPFPVNIAVAPGVAAGATAAMQAGAVAASASGAAAGSGGAAFHTGGIVDGGVRQEVPAVLLGGEMVLTRSQQARLFDAVRGRGATSGETSPNVTIQVNLPNYVGDRRDLEATLLELFRQGPLRTEVQRAASGRAFHRKRVR